MKYVSTFLWGVFLASLSPTAAPAETPVGPVTQDCYLFCYFVGNGEDGLHLAWSADGLAWEPLNDGRSFLTPSVGKSRLMRDPCINQGPDGTFHMVWTDSWNSATIGHASSKDLITWSPQQVLPVMTHEPEVENCWAPEIIYDAKARRFLIFWASTIPGRFPESEVHGDDNNHRIYATTTNDFKSFSKSIVFFDPGFNCIDSSILPLRGKAYMFFKDETRIPKPMKNLRLAVADQIAGSYHVMKDSINPPGAWVEGPSALQIGKTTYLYFDAYTKGHYAALSSHDLRSWKDVTHKLSMPKGTRHGTAFPVTGTILKALLEFKTNKKSFEQETGGTTLEKLPDRRMKSIHKMAMIRKW